MKLNDITISRVIIESFTKDFLDYLNVDVAIVGGGPSGIVAAYYLAKEKKKVVVLERKLSIGGGMWGGGMMFNKIVVQEKAKFILDEFEINYHCYEAKPQSKASPEVSPRSSKSGYYVADSVEATSTLCSKAAKAGAKFFNLMSVEDIKIEQERINGLVINWSAVELSKLHVDPLTISAKFVIDATGHSAEIANMIVKKLGRKLPTSTGDILGEKPMWAEKGEADIIKNSKEIYPNLYVSGMAANAVFGAPRMGPIFGGMLLSGRAVARKIIKAGSGKRGAGSDRGVKR